MHHTCFARRAIGCTKSGPRRRPKVGAIVDGRREMQRQVARSPPRAPRAVILAQPPGDEIEILLRDTPAFFDDALEAFAVCGQEAGFGHRLGRRLEQGQMAGRKAGAEGVEGLLALAAVRRPGRAWRNTASWEEMRDWPMPRTSCISATDSSSRITKESRRRRVGSEKVLRISQEAFTG